MRKSILCICLAAAILAVSVPTAQAATPEQLFTGMGHKLLRGAINTLTGWVEFPVQINKGFKRGFAGNENNKVCGTIGGIFAGVWHTVGRTLSGVGDIAGFWAADPASNENVGIPLDAEYAWEEGTGYDLYKPNFGEATVQPIANKLGRGFGNALFGFVEFPGQIVKGIKNGAPDLGIVKGLWYWYSREIDGTFDICTFPLPNPKDTKALPFDEKWPWSALGDSMQKSAATK